ncbi:MAG: alpha/beta fold hydrolase [Pseudonocardiaceae bacterium]
MAYAENGGTRLFWAQSGAGPTVVLIQGFGYTHDMWYRTVPVLSPGYRVIRFDNPGVGMSDVPPRAYRVSNMAQDAATVLDAAEADGPTQARRRPRRDAGVPRRALSGWTLTRSMASGRYRSCCVGGCQPRHGHLASEGTEVWAADERPGLSEFGSGRARCRTQPMGRDTERRRPRDLDLRL